MSVLDLAPPEKSTGRTVVREFRLEICQISFAKPCLLI
jgi:hypothetical protein